MTVPKSHREFEMAYKELGCDILDFQRTGGGHYVFVLRHPDCGEFKQFVSYTPSDWRCSMKAKAACKRTIRERAANPKTRQT